MTRSSIVSAFAAGLLTIGIGAGASAETLVVCTEVSPDFLNPQFSNQNTAYDVSTQIYERLVGVERGGSKLVPSLAKSWSHSDDGLIVTFKLRPGVKWHSNRHFTPTRNLNADDVVYTFRRMMDERDPYAKVGGVNYAVLRHHHPADPRARREGRRPDGQAGAEAAPGGASRRALGRSDVDPLGRICRGDAEGRHARSHGVGADRDGALRPRELPEGRDGPLSRLPGSLGEGRGPFGPHRAGERPRLRHHLGRERALRQGQVGRVPDRPLSEPRRSRSASRRAQSRAAVGHDRRHELPRLQQREEALRRPAGARGAGLCDEHPGDHRRRLSRHRKADGGAEFRRPSGAITTA